MIRTCIAETLIKLLVGLKFACNHHEGLGYLFLSGVLISTASVTRPLSCTSLCYLLTLFLKGWRSKGRRWELLIKSSVNTTLLSQSSYVISRLGHEKLKEKPIKHFFRQILWHAPSMTARPVTLWGRCQPATASPFLCLWLDYSCQLVNVLIEAQLVWKSANLLSWRRSCTIGSTVMVITALTTIAQQLISDCKHYGIDALSSNQASGRFNQWEINFHPVCLCTALIGRVCGGDGSDLRFWQS